MASTKSLFFLAFALPAVVLAVSSSPVLESKRSEDKFANEYNFGERQEGDFLANTKVFSVSQSNGQPNVYKKLVKVGPDQVITYITAIDQTDTGSEVYLVSGGPGRQSAVLSFDTYDGTMSFMVKVYAKKL